MGDWGLTVADVFNETGANVSASDLAIASASVEIHLNATPGVSAVLRKRDLHWILTSIKWQAAWLPGQPDYAERMDTDSVSQDGASAKFKQVLLGPLAKRALKNVSWKGSRTLEMLDERYRLGKRPGTAIPFELEESDDFSDWQALPS